MSGEIQSLVRPTFSTDIRHPFPAERGQIRPKYLGSDREYFAATIGGMGLTGAISWASIQLRRIASPFLRVASYRFGDLSEFFALDLQNKD
jgi:hypothetical protein